MCGIAGFISKSENIDFETVLLNMGSAIKKRGPDDYGIWFDKNSGIGFSHRRLSILDLSPLGHQPMLSSDGRYRIIFNGEIYNHLELRDYIKISFPNTEWKSNSDTETILMLIVKIGLVETIKKLNGMFSIAVWDSIENTLYLTRDRIGEKPLYYGWQNNSFLFASELKSFYHHPDFSKNIDKDALKLFFKHNYIPYPYSIYANINKLKPGTILKLDTRTFDSSIIVYWDFINVIKSKKSLQNINLDFNTNIIELEKLLINSIKNQMISDVPLGAFLSGGVDSSLIVSIMQSISANPIKTFTIGFNEQQYDEAIYAKKVSNHLKTDHTEIYLSSKDAISVINDLPKIYDEPFSDSSQIPTFLVSKLAKTQVTVALSGDAGDELFAGYNRYIIANNVWPKIKIVPFFIRKLISKFILLFPTTFYDNIYQLSNKFICNKTKLFTNVGDKIYKISYLILSKSFENLYDNLISHWNEYEPIVKGNYNNLNKEMTSYEFLNDIEKMMAADTISYLPDDILVKVDRAAMANSLETRVPFLDYRIIEFAWQIPIFQKLNSNKSKLILREILYKYVPKELIERPKMGFGVPIAEWLRGPLKNWAEEILSEEKIINDDLLDYKIIKKKWDEHQSGKHNWQYHLWDVLMFQSWYDYQKTL
jgi:asparagine synthase (glutamine-hydrolysing)